MDNEIKEQEVIEQTMFSVKCDNEGRYVVEISNGMSVNEVAFGMVVIMKCFERDGVIKADEMLELINKYMGDPQYEELKN